MDLVMPSFDELLWAESRLEVQVSLLLLQAVFWKVAIPFFAVSVVKPWIIRKPWFEQWKELTIHGMQAIGITGLSPEASEKLCFGGPGILLQHGIGGALCIPAVFGLLPPEVATSLALHGALCEAGWEFQDGVTRAWQVMFGGEKGREANPKALLIFMGIHHAMGLSMVVPMNLYFRDLHSYHEGAFLLQFAAFAAMVAQNYGFTCNTDTQSGLNQMRAATLFTFCAMAYSRGFRYVVVVYRTVYALYLSGFTVMFAGSVVVAVLMSLLNFVFLKDASTKLVKFWKKSLDNDTSPKAKSLLRHASFESVHSIGGVDGTPFPFALTSAQKNWAKLRGAVAIQALHKSVRSDTKKSR